MQLLEMHGMERVDKVLNTPLYWSVSKKISTFSVSGGATLGPLNTTIIRLLPNDYPNGVVTVLQYPRVISDESSGIVQVTILREKGTYGKVTVDFYTASGSAISRSGVVFYANVEYVFPQNNIKLVHHFNSSDGTQYLLVSNNIRVRLYQWKGTWHESKVSRKSQFFVENLQICLLLLVKFLLSFVKCLFKVSHCCWLWRCSYLP